MAKAEWGTKRTCTTCGARFYDLQRDPIICPKCGAENEKDVAKVKRGGKSSRNDATKKATASVSRSPIDEEDEVDDVLIEEEDDDVDDEGLMEDASDLGEDDDDMAEVIDHLEPGEKEE